jgi:hypothetical protein
MSHAERTSQALWQEVETLCAQSTQLAQAIASRLSRGVAGHQLIPLLRQAADQALLLRQGIGRLVHCPVPLDLKRRDGLTDRLRTLVELEESNHGLLRTRGLSLTRNRPYRYGPAANGE